MTCAARPRRLCLAKRLHQLLLDRELASGLAPHERRVIGTERQTLEVRIARVERLSKAVIGPRYDNLGRDVEATHDAEIAAALASLEAGAVEAERVARLYGVLP